MIEPRPHIPPEIAAWNLKLFSINTNGLNTSYRAIFDQFALINHITMGQETRFKHPSEVEKPLHHWQLATNYEGQAFFEEPLYNENPLSLSTGGLFMLFHPDSPLTNLTATETTNPTLKGRYQQVHGNLGHFNIYLHNIYAPNSPADRAIFFSNLPRTFPQHALHIVGGDFNCVLSASLDGYRTTLYNRAGTEELLEWLNHMNLHDIFREQNPLMKIATNPKQTNRIDYIFVSTILAKLPHWKAGHVQFVPTADHSACTISTPPPSRLRGKGHWKVPTWLLQLDLAESIIHSHLDKFLDLSPTFTNLGLAYDKMLHNIRMALRELHHQQLDKQDEPLKRISFELIQLSRQHSSSPTPESLERIQQLKDNMQTEYENQQQFKAGKAFQTHVNKAERCSKFHLRTPKTSPLEFSAITKITQADGNVTENPEAISQTLTDFYQDLFQPSQPLREDIDTFLEPLTKRKLPRAHAKILDAPLTAHDFYQAIKSSSTSTAPGPNSLPFEALKLAPNKWALVLELVFSAQLNPENTHQSLTSSQLLSVLVLLFKKGDKTLPKNYRPINLLNTDVKILTLILAKRLQHCLPSIIHPDQQGFIKGGNIQLNIQRLDDLMHYMEHAHKEGMVALLDFEKAFDRVDHQYLLRVLQAYNFPPNFINTIKTIYSKRRSTILLNGTRTKSFAIGRGVLQGDPLSPLLFLLALEPMAELLRKHPQYGIPTGPTIHTGSYFADDSQLYSNDEAAMQAQLKLVKRFCHFSGFKINTDKTQILTFATVSPALQPMVVTADKPAKSLGILVAPHLHPNARFQYVFDKFQARLNLWRYRARTLAGQIVILQSICLPVLWYQLAFVLLSVANARLIDKLLLQFIHKETINPAATRAESRRFLDSKIIFGNKNEGGLGLHRSEHKWLQHNRAVMLRCLKAIFQHSTNDYGQPTIAHWISPGYKLIQLASPPHITPQDLLHQCSTSPILATAMASPYISPNWKNMLQLWLKSRFSPTTRPSTIQTFNIPLWHNPFNPFLPSHTSSKWIHIMLAMNITRISDLLDEHNQLYNLTQLQETLKQHCRRRNIPLPNTHWLRNFHETLQAGISTLPEDSEDIFTGPFLTAKPPPTSQWLIQTQHKLIPLALSTSRHAILSSQQPLKPTTIPTKHLHLAPDFYEDPDRLRQLAALRQPPHILPKYSDFIFKLAIRANALQYLFYYLQDDKHQCIFCNGNETHDHFLFDCPNTKAVLKPFKQISRKLQCPFPNNPTQVFFDTPLPQNPKLHRGYNILWSILRPCIYYTIWLNRNDQTFRPDLPKKPPDTIAIQAANITRLHISRLFQIPGQHKKPKELRIIFASLKTIPWISEHLIPKSILFVPNVPSDDLVVP